MAQLQQAYPNCLHLEFPRVALPAGAGHGLADLATRSETEHFADFFELVTDEQLSAAERDALGAVVERLERRWRET